MRPRTRAPILAQRRSGSTLLCHALSNHPEVFCARGEPLHRLNTWRWAFGGADNPWGDEVYRPILSLAFNQWGYAACAAKVNWAPGTERVWDWLASWEPPVKAIRLTRENRLRQAVSDVIRRRTKSTARPRVHTHEPLPAYRAVIDPVELFALMAQLDADEAGGSEVLRSRGIAVLPLTYADLVGEEGEEVDALPSAASDRLCDWLEVDRLEALSGWPARRVNPLPLRELLTNWPDVERAVGQSCWAACLEDEARWS